MMPGTTCLAGVGANPSSLNDNYSKGRQELKKNS